MYLHLGSDIIVNMKDIIAVFDMDNTTVAKSSRAFLAKAQQEGEVISAAEELPKSYIVTSYKGQTRVYLSSISPSTLLKRAKSSAIIL